MGVLQIVPLREIKLAHGAPQMGSNRVGRVPRRDGVGATRARSSPSYGLPGHRLAWGRPHVCPATGGPSSLVAMCPSSV